MKPKLNYLILCDDIRQELGNKITLVGIYGNQIYVPQFPHTFPKLCMQISLGGVTKKVKVDIRIRKSGSSKIINKFDDIDLTPPTKINPQQLIISLGIIPFVVNEKGIYVVEIIFDKDRSKIAYKFNIDCFPKKPNKERKSTKR
jgi:hypothetical protein